MKRTIAVLAAVALLAVCATAYALYGVNEVGEWPKTWPAELEGLRKQARTLEGPIGPQLHYAIYFSKREEFEAAWRHVLKVKAEGAPIVLVRGPNFFLGKERKAGVVVHVQVPSPVVKDEKGRGKNTTFIELVVDGEIVDLNRISLPGDTPIVDERFKDENKK